LSLHLVRCAMRELSALEARRQRVAQQVEALRGAQGILASAQPAKLAGGVFLSSRCGKHQEAMLKLRREHEDLLQRAMDVDRLTTEAIAASQEECRSSPLGRFQAAGVVRPPWSDGPMEPDPRRNTSGAASASPRLSLGISGSTFLSQSPPPRGRSWSRCPPDYADQPPRPSIYSRDSPRRRVRDSRLLSPYRPILPHRVQMAYGMPEWSAKHIRSSPDCQAHMAALDSSKGGGQQHSLDFLSKSSTELPATPLRPKSSPATQHSSGFHDSSFATMQSRRSCLGFESPVLREGMDLMCKRREALALATLRLTLDSQLSPSTSRLQQSSLLSSPWSAGQASWSVLGRS